MEKRFWFGGARKTEDELLTSYSFKWLEVSVTTDQYDIYYAPFLREDLNLDEQVTSMYQDAGCLD